MFDKWVLNGAKETAGTTLTEDNTGAVATAIKATPGSIGYVSIGFVTGPNKMILTDLYQWREGCRG